MSYVKHENELVPMLEHVNVQHWYPEDLAKAVVNADASSQAEFFLRFAEQCNKIGWPMQCRHIVDEINGAGSIVGPHIRGHVLSVLDTLVEHLREGIGQ